MKKTIKKANSKWILLFLFTFLCVGVQGQYDEYGSSGGCDPNSITATEQGGTYDSNGVNQYGIQRTIDHWEKVPDVPQSASSGQAVVLSKAVYKYSCAKKQNTGPMTGSWYSTTITNNSLVGGGATPKPPCTLQASYCASIGRILVNCGCVEKPCEIKSCPTGSTLKNCECVKNNPDCFKSPVPNSTRITSLFMASRDCSVCSKTHGGTDYAVPTGTPIKSSASGVVARSYFSLTYGNVVIIDHGVSNIDNNHVYTLYAHGSSRIVNQGDVVKEGDNVIYSGNTGNSSGPHLHYEVIKTATLPSNGAFFKGLDKRYAPEQLKNIINKNCN